jgi:hypothetical protein
MSADLQGFDASAIEVSTFDPLPPGWYTATIVESDMVETRAKNGNFLKLEFEIVDGEHAKRKLWTNLNLDNPNPLAVQIAKGELASICKAVGIIKPKDSAELHNIPLEIKIALRKRDDNGEDANEIKAYRPLSTAAADDDAGVPAWIK